VQIDIHLASQNHHKSHVHSAQSKTATAYVITQKRK
jgi:hypothetical protein